MNSLHFNGSTLQIFRGKYNETIIIGQNYDIQELRKRSRNYITESIQEIKSEYFFFGFYQISHQPKVWFNSFLVIKKIIQSTNLTAKAETSLFLI